MFLRRLILLSLLLAAHTGCSTLVGNVDPVDEKSHEYGIADLSKEKPSEWTKLDPAKVASDDADEDTPASSPDVSDVAFQSRNTAATISLNSACRPANAAPSELGQPSKDSDRELRKLTDQLFLGLTDVTLREEKALSIQSSPSMETTVRGKMENEPVMLRVVVFRKRDCIYDLVYLSPPEHFAKNESDFSHFVASLRLK